MTLNYWMMVERCTQFLKKRLAVWFLTVKSPFYLSKTWCWHVDLLSQKKKLKDNVCKEGTNTPPFFLFLFVCELYRSSPGFVLYWCSWLLVGRDEYSTTSDHSGVEIISYLLFVHISIILVFMPSRSKSLRFSPTLPPSLRPLVHGC